MFREIAALMNLDWQWRSQALLLFRNAPAHRVTNYSSNKDVRQAVWA